MRTSFSYFRTTVYNNTSCLVFELTSTELNSGDICMILLMRKGMYTIRIASYYGTWVGNGISVDSILSSSSKLIIRRATNNIHQVILEIPIYDYAMLFGFNFNTDAKITYSATIPDAPEPEPEGE